MIQKLVLLFSLMSLGLACQPTPSNTAINSESANSAPANQAADAEPGNSDSASPNQDSEGQTIETNVPEQYQARVVLRLETTGENNKTVPAVSALVYRVGSNRRMELTLPNGEKIIYLTLDSRQFLLVPTRRQYAEINKQALGFEVRQMMTPEHLAAQVKTIKGVQRAGEEKYNSMEVVKYTFSSTNPTQTSAGEVKTDSFVLVDKKTGLPVRSETLIESQSTDIKGVRGIRFVTEINDIKTEVDGKLFELPTDYQRVDPEEVKKQVESFLAAAEVILGQILKSAQPDQ